MDTLSIAELSNPKLDILDSYQLWTRSHEIDIQIDSEPINAPITIVLLYLTNPRNESWYPSTKSSIKLIKTQDFTEEPAFIDNLNLYQASKGHKWEVVANLVLYNQMYYDYIEIDPSNYLVRLIASPDDKNDITWQVFYKVSDTPEGITIRMEVFFIGFPKFGIKQASKRVRTILALIFSPILLAGFNKKLKKTCEK